jgi:hypothetical protein
MHIHPLPVSSIPVQIRRHNHQLVLCDEVPNAALILRCVVCLYGVEVEFEGGGEWQERQQHAAEEA